MIAVIARRRLAGCRAASRHVVHHGAVNVARPSAPELQRRISLDISGVEDLWELVHNNIAHLDEGHAVSCLARAVDLGYRWDASTPPPTALVSLVSSLRAHLESGRLRTSNLARLTTAIASISGAEPGLVQKLADEARRRVASCSAIDVAMLSRAFAMLRRTEPVEVLIAVAAERASGFGTQALVNIAWAAATARLLPSIAVTGVIDEAARRGERLKPQALANLVWALAALRNRQESALEALLPHVGQRIPDFAPQGVTATLWGLAMLRPSGSPDVGWLEEDVVLRLAVQAMRRIECFGAPELTSVARAAVVYASARTAGGSWAPLIDAVIGESRRNLKRFLPRHLADLAWAVAKIQHRDTSTLDAIALQATDKARSLGPQEAGSLLWAMASFQLRHLPLLAALRARIQRLPEEDLHFRTITGLVWAHAMLSVRAEDLPGGSCDRRLASLAARRAHEGNALEIANLAWASALLGRPDGPLLEALANEVKLHGGFTAHHCANASWAFAVGRIQDECLYGTLSRRFLACAAQPLYNEKGTRDWVVMVEGLCQIGGDCRLPGTPQHELLAAFEDAIYEPAVRRLETLVGSDGHREAAALRALSSLATSLGLAHLGSVHTRAALRRLGLARHHHCAEQSTSWATTAAEVLRVRPDGSAAGPPHQRDVAAWIACDISVRVADVEQAIREEGRVVTFSIGQDTRSELQALAVYHDRTGHAERVALVSVLNSIRSAERRLHRRVLLAAEPGFATIAGGREINHSMSSVSGTVRLFATHTPCLSCVAVFVQFARRFPDISLTVAFEDACLMVDSTSI